MKELSYKARRRWSLVVLLVWLPAYVILIVPLLAMIVDWNIWLRVVIYILAAFVWVVPFRFVFRGVGRADPDAEDGSSGDEGGG